METATSVASLAAVPVVVLASAEQVGPADRPVVETAMAAASLMTVVLTATLGPRLTMSSCHQHQGMFQYRIWTVAW